MKHPDFWHDLDRAEEIPVREIFALLGFGIACVALPLFFLSLWMWLEGLVG